MTLMMSMNLDFAWGANTAVSVSDIGPLILIRRRHLYDISFLMLLAWSY